jgi:phospholipid/cholesterol/gamma-HCH transport system substrate-binding protein
VGPAKGFLYRLSNHAYGVVFLVVVALLVGLSVAMFQGRFTRTVDVTLLTDRIGSQLQRGSDVKLRGMIIGQVSSVSVTAKGARLGLALDPGQVDLVPAGVRARLLPKTLFGERFVDLVSPAAGSAVVVAGAHLRAGDVIGQDRSSVAIELETVFADLLPLLRAVQPGKLAATLNALASALEGRGQRLGDNLVLVDDYFKQLNPSLPVIKADISGLADLASTYATAAPELVAAAHNLVTTNATIVTKKDSLAGFLASTAGFANTTADFLDANGDRIIQVGRVNRPTVQTFAKYSPEYPCLAAALTNWIPRIDQAWRDDSFHLTIEAAPQRPGYHPGEEPRWGEDRGPNCYGLPDHYGSQASPRKGIHFNDGTSGGGSSAGSALPQLFAGQSGMAVADPDSGLAGTAQEQRLVTSLLDPDAAHPSAITTLLAGPILRGTVVSQE